MDPYKLKNDQLCEVMKKLRTDLEKGLAAETHDSATVKCYQTYIQEVPSGNGNNFYL